MAVRKRVWLSTPWHNYSDRRKVLIDKSNYQDYVLYEEDNTHFNHGDTINSSCITITDTAMLLNPPNYLLIFNGEDIESRWYAMNRQFISGEPAGGKNKWEITLLRDIVIDRRAAIGEGNSIKIIRGKLPDVWSPLMMNPEHITTNDILQREIDLKDVFGIDWYTIYYDANNPISISSSSNEPPNMRFTWAQLSSAFTFADGASLQETNGNISTISGRNRRRRYLESFDITYNVRVYYNADILIGYPGPWQTEQLGTCRYRYIAARNSAGAIVSYTLQAITRTVDSKYIDRGTMGRWTVSNLHAKTDDVAAELFNRRNPDSSNVITGVNNAANSVTDDRRATVDPIIDLYNNNYIDINNNASFFTVTRPNGSISNTNNDVTNGLLPGALSGASLSSSIMTTGTSLHGGYPIEHRIILSAPVVANYQIFEEIFDGSGNRVTNAITLDLPEGNVLDEVVIGCVTIPVSDNLIVDINGSGPLEMSANAIKRLVTGGITSSAGKDNIYAIEKLPYSPIPSLDQFYNPATKTLTIPSGSAVDNLLQSMKDVASTPVWYAFRVQTASNEFLINLPEDDPILNPAGDFKRKAMTESVKIVSPNHTAQMVLKPVANHGIQRIRVQATLRPNGTYYRWTPEFDGLHGRIPRPNDDRGIVQEGGFIIPIVTNEYIDWTRTNSMYREIFNTEVQFMESNNNIGRMSEQMNADHSYNQAYRSADFSQQMAQANAGLGILGSVAGMGVSAATGNVKGMLASAGGLLTSGIKGGMAAQQGNFSRETADIDYAHANAQMGLNDELRANSIAQKQALFDLDIATIKNRPNTISQTSGLNINNRGCAYIQIYACTEQESVNIENYLNMQGMSINQFGNVNDYLIGDECYIEAMIIFLPGSTPIELNAINAELSRGVYIEEGLFGGM